MALAWVAMIEIVMAYQGVDLLARKIALDVLFAPRLPDAVGGHEQRGTTLRTIQSMGRMGYGLQQISS